MNSNFHGNLIASPSELDEDNNINIAIINNVHKTDVEANEAGAGAGDMDMDMGYISKENNIIEYTCDNDDDNDGDNDEKNSSNYDNNKRSCTSNGAEKTEQQNHHYHHNHHHHHHQQPLQKQQPQPQQQKQQPQKKLKRVKFSGNINSNKNAMENGETTQKNMIKASDGEQKQALTMTQKQKQAQRQSRQDFLLNFDSRLQNASNGTTAFGTSNSTPSDPLNDASSPPTKAKSQLNSKTEATPSVSEPPKTPESELLPRPEGTQSNTSKPNASSPSCSSSSSFATASAHTAPPSGSATRSKPSTIPSTCTENRKPGFVVVRWYVSPREAVDKWGCAKTRTGTTKRKREPDSSSHILPKEEKDDDDDDDDEEDVDNGNSNNNENEKSQTQGENSSYFIQELTREHSASESDSSKEAKPKLSDTLGVCLGSAQLSEKERGLGVAREAVVAVDVVTGGKGEEAGVQLGYRLTRMSCKSADTGTNREVVPTCYQDIMIFMTEEASKGGEFTAIFAPRHVQLLVDPSLDAEEVEAKHSRIGAEYQADVPDFPRFSEPSHDGSLLASSLEKQREYRRQAGVADGVVIGVSGDDAAVEWPFPRYTNGKVSESHMPTINAKEFELALRKTALRDWRGIGKILGVSTAEVVQFYYDSFKFTPAYERWRMETKMPWRDKADPSRCTRCGRSGDLLVCISCARSTHLECRANIEALSISASTSSSSQIQCYRCVSENTPKTRRNRSSNLEGFPSQSITTGGTAGVVQNSNSFLLREEQEDGAVSQRRGRGSSSNLLRRGSRSRNGASNTGTSRKDDAFQTGTNDKDDASGDENGDDELSEAPRKKPVVAATITRRKKGQEHRKPLDASSVNSNPNSTTGPRLRDSTTTTHRVEDQPQAAKTRKRKNTDSSQVKAPSKHVGSGGGGEEKKEAEEEEEEEKAAEPEVGQLQDLSISPDHLHSVVKRLGGFEKVTVNNHWEHVSMELGLARTTDVNAQIKATYASYFPNETRDDEYHSSLMPTVSAEKADLPIHKQTRINYQNGSSSSHVGTTREAATNLKQPVSATGPDPA